MSVEEISVNEDVRFIVGDVREALKALPNDSINAIVTDPPYELTAPGDKSAKGGFMGCKWDATGVAFDVDVWKEALRVLKPGGHLLAFSGTRTYHRMACAIEDAGFEIRDQIQWHYGTGWPKGQDVSKLIDKELGAERKIIGRDPIAYRPNAEKAHKEGQTGSFGLKGEGSGLITEAATKEAKQWEGWNTTLKPAHEPICMARKPLSEKNVAQNVLKHGTGAINIDACRVEYQGDADKASATPQGKCTSKEVSALGAEPDAGREMERIEFIRPEQKGRYPANIILDETSAVILDKQTGILTSGTGAVKGDSSKGYRGRAFGEDNREVGTPNIEYGDSGGASRFFYVAKSPRSERDDGCNEMYWELDSASNVGYKQVDKATWEGLHPHKRARGNIHTTVKPIDLMLYLCKMVTHKGGIVLDMFSGSGTTAIACQKEGFKFIGIEKEKPYVEIAQSRLTADKGKMEPIDIFDQI